MNRIVLSLCGVPIVALLTMQPSRAQTYPPCQPPRPNEYLLMVLNPTEDVQTQLRNALPANATATVCTYINNTVLRVDGFNSLDSADSWAQYVSDSSGLQAFVARPATTATVPPAATPAAPTPPSDSSTGEAIAPPPATATTPPPTTPPADESFPQPTLPPAAATTPPASPPSATAAPSTLPAQTAVPAQPEASTGYNPQPLGAGYAVLVDYANRPEVAIELRQVLVRDVGLVAYGQRPYLLATYTTDLAQANTLLQTLSDRNFTALIVDGRGAMLLTPVVAKLE